MSSSLLRALRAGGFRAAPFALRPCFASASVAAAALPRLGSVSSSVVSAASSAASAARLQQRRAQSSSTAKPEGGEGMSTSPDTPPEGGEAAGGGVPAAAAAAAAADEVARLKASVVELNGARLRLLAEMENVRRIALRDVDTAKQYALQSFAKRLLDVADNLRRAVESVPPAARSGPGKPAAAPPGEGVFATLYEGVAATEKELLKAMASVGIEGFGAPGERFDPNRHEAMAQVPASAQQPDQTVAAVLKSGFKLKERVIRPAQVAVAIAPQAE